MRNSKMFWGLGASALAMSMASTPILAQASQGAQQSANTAIDDELSDEEKTQIGVIVGGGVLAAAATKLHSDPKPKMRKISKAEMNRFSKTSQSSASQSRPTSLKQLKQRGDAARAARANRIAGSADDMAELERRGNAAKSARQVKTAPRARPANITNSNLARMIERGENAQRARVNRVAGSADDLTELNRRGNAAKNARLNKTAPARKGNGMKVTFRDQVRAKPAPSKLSTKGADSFGRKLISPKGANADVARLVRKGDAAQVARGRMVNEGQVVRNIANKGGDISKLNKAGRSAQVARGAGGLKAASKATDAAKMAKTAKLAKTAKVGATAAKIGKGGRAALAGTGVGAVVIAAEIAGKESVKALTGAEVQDPISTGFQYGAAIFDKDVSLRDVAAQRRAHHRENFRKLGQTFTTKGKLKENLSTYGQEKGAQIRKTAVKVDRFDRNVRTGIKDKTGLTLERGSDVRKRYGAAAMSKKPVKAVAQVAKGRAEHHINNAKAVGKKTKCGIGNLFRSKKKDKKC
ncbi:hypothetical protein [Parasphingorhabdus sp.]|uniref:hypothetical protein n=1 Tax=Parasphingorhabdus sp. TaxID=2709688 RepID=UPI003264D1EF